VDASRIMSTRDGGRQVALLLSLGRSGARHGGARDLDLDGRGHPGRNTAPNHVGRRQRGRNQSKGHIYPSPSRSGGHVR